MPTLTLAVPEDLKKKMDELPEMNWSEIARKAISEKVKEYTLFKSIVAKSKLTEEDALHLGKEVNNALHERYRKAYRELQ
jgi:predicted transcriptional regulator